MKSSRRGGPLLLASGGVPDAVNVCNELHAMVRAGGMVRARGSWRRWQFTWATAWRCSEAPTTGTPSDILSMIHFAAFSPPGTIWGNDPLSLDEVSSAAFCGGTLCAENSLALPPCSDCIQCASLPLHRPQNKRCSCATESCQKS